MAYNTETQIRQICGMSTTKPSSAVITRWQLLIDAMITRFNPSPDADLAALIESNRISELWWDMKTSNNTPNQNQQTFIIQPLSDAEREMLDSDDYYGSVPMNGKQDYNTARR